MKLIPYAQLWLHVACQGSATTLSATADSISGATDPKALHRKTYRLQQDLALARASEQQLRTNLDQQTAAAKEATAAAEATARRQFRMNKELEKTRDAALGGQQAAEKLNK